MGQIVEQGALIRDGDRKVWIRHVDDGGAEDYVEIPANSLEEIRDGATAAMAEVEARALARAEAAKEAPPEPAPEPAPEEDPA